MYADRVKCVYLFALIIFSCAANGLCQSDKRPDPATQKEPVVSKPADKSETIEGSKPVDPNQYPGWQKIDEDRFSFYAPKDMQGGKGKGIDTAVYDYKGSGLEIGFDIGMLANPMPRFPAHKVITINGHLASIWYSPRRSHLYLSQKNGRIESNFNMYIFSESNDQDQHDIAEKIFLSLRLK
jgi:hypothetical protein